MVERFFAELTEKRIRRGVFTSVAELEEAIMTYLQQHNASPKPFVWTKSVGEILEKVAKAKQAFCRSGAAVRATPHGKSELRLTGSCFYPGSEPFRRYALLSLMLPVLVPRFIPLLTAPLFAPLRGANIFRNASASLHAMSLWASSGGNIRPIAFCGTSCARSS
jgi:hypothetical protein